MPTLAPLGQRVAAAGAEVSYVPHRANLAEEVARLARRGDVVIMLGAMSGATQLDYGMPPALSVILVLNGAAVALAALSLPAALFGGRKWTVRTRMTETVFALALSPLVVLLPYLGLVSLG